MRVEPAGQRAERRHDDLGRREHEAAARDLPAAEVDAAAWDGSGRRFPGAARRAPLRGEGRSRRSRPRPRCVPPQWSAKPGSWLPTIQVQSSRCGQFGQQLAGARRQPIAAEAVVEAVAEAIEAVRAGPLDLGRRAPSASRANHRAEGIGRAARTSSPFRGAGRRPAARLLGGPEQRAVGSREERFACERKGNHGPAVTPARRSG